MRVRDHALAVVTEFGRLDWRGMVDLAWEYRLLLIRDWLPHQQPEYRLDRLIIVNAEMPATYQLWYSAHALGHAILHRGDQKWIRDNCYGLVGKQEEAAERFAAFFLIPDLASGTDDLEIPADKLAYRVALERVCGLAA